jgi:hypothetical protein
VEAPCQSPLTLHRSEPFLIFSAGGRCRRAISSLPCRACVVKDERESRIHETFAHLANVGIPTVMWLIYASVPYTGVRCETERSEGVWTAVDTHTETTSTTEISFDFSYSSILVHGTGAVAGAIWRSTDVHSSHMQASPVPNRHVAAGATRFWLYVSSFSCMSDTIPCIPKTLRGIACLFVLCGRIADLAFFSRGKVDFFDQWKPCCALHQAQAFLPWRVPP